MIEALIIIGSAAFIITLIWLYVRSSKKIKLEKKAKEEKVETPKVSTEIPDIHQIVDNAKLNINSYIEEKPKITFINTPPPQAQKEEQQPTKVIATRDKNFKYSDNFFGVDVGEEKTPTKSKSIAQQINELSPELKAILFTNALNRKE